MCSCQPRPATEIKFWFLAFLYIHCFFYVFLNIFFWLYKIIWWCSLQEWLLNKLLYSSSFLFHRLSSWESESCHFSHKHFGKQSTSKYICIYARVYVSLSLYVSLTFPFLATSPCHGFFVLPGIIYLFKTCTETVLHNELTNFCFVQVVFQIYNQLVRFIFFVVVNL